MAIPLDAPEGAAVRWIGDAYSEGSHTTVKPGEVGTFLCFDGPPFGEVVVSFPALTFVTPKENVELVSRI
jgi:hypothetical protein